MSKPLILVTNDDGITSPGIQALTEAVKDMGEIVVVAPDKPQSGVGHAITINATLRMNKLSSTDGIERYSCTGTPVDCVKLAVNRLLDRKPDLVVSGINHGSNSSINVIYSGTMSAAIEGSLEGIPSIGFSLLSHSIDADFSAARKYAGIVTRKVLQSGLPQDVCLNVNIPKLHEDEIMGIKVCRQARAYWFEEFDARQDPNGNEYYWMTGEFVNQDEGQDTDEWALANNFVSVVPTQCDLTAYKALEEIKKLEDDK
jgi:5'/3'-nucleotidase